MSCPPHTSLIAFAANELDSNERSGIAAHVESPCAACAREVAAIAAIRALARRDELEDPPAVDVLRAARIPAEIRDRSLRALAGRVAALVFDTTRDALPAGARTTATSTRHALYRALDYDIDVRVGPAAGELVRVTGQVLPGPNRPIHAASGLEVALVADEATSVAETNDLGEFDFGVQSPGNYTIAVEAAEERLVVERFSARLG